MIKCFLWSNLVFHLHTFSPACPTSTDVSVQFSSISRVPLFVTQWTTVCQDSLSITNSQSLLKLLFIKSVMSSNHLIPCCPHLLLPSIFPSIRFFSNESILRIWCPKFQLGVSASASDFIMNVQDWFSLGLTSWISLQSKGHSRVFSNTTVQKHQFGWRGRWEGGSGRGIHVNPWLIHVNVWQKTTTIL